MKKTLLVLSLMMVLLSGSLSAGVDALAFTKRSTDDGLSISTGGGVTFNNHSLEGHAVYGGFAVGNTVYAATQGGLFIGPATATQLAFLDQPQDAVFGASTGSIAVEILDANGYRVTNNTSSVTLSIANNAGSGTLSGTATVNAVSGLATFNDLSINKLGEGYTLSAESAGLFDNLSVASGGEYSGVSNTQWLAQAFSTTATDYVINKVSLPLWNSMGTTGSFEVQVWDASGTSGSPGTQVGSAIYTGQAENLENSSSLLTITGLNVVLAADTTYYLVAQGTGLTDDPLFSTLGALFWDSANVNTSDSFAKSGSSWSLINNYDFYMKVNGLTSATSSAFDVTSKELTIGGAFTASNKVFDNTTTADIATNSLTLTGVVGSDAVSLIVFSAEFATAAVGNGQTVSITSARITGDDASNYTFSLTGAPTTTADITAPITIGNDTIVRCKGVAIGDKQTISGIEYEVVDRDLLITRRDEDSDLTKVCVSNVTDMSSMFLNSTSFNQAIGNWDVSSVTNMFLMFSGSSFNQSLDSWDVSSVIDMIGLFLSSLFNQSLDNWNVSNVLFMDYMFYQSQFNQDIGKWDVSSVTNMDYMFTDSSFNQPINSWCVSQITAEPTDFSIGSLLSQDNKPIWGGCLVISKLPNTAEGGSTIRADSWKAMLFTTGSSPRQLASVVVGLNPYPTNQSTPFTQGVKISLFSVAGGNPHTELLTTGLVSVTMPARQGVYTFLDASSFTMAPNTQYALVLSSNASNIKWGANGGSSTTPTASAGLTYNSFLQSTDAGVNWTTSLASNNAFAIRMVPIPPTTISLTGPSTVQAGSTSTNITLRVEDANGNPSNVFTNTVFALSTADESGTATFTPSPVTVLAGSSLATFTYSNTKVGDGAHTLTATRSSGDMFTGSPSATHDITVTSGTAATISINDGNNQNAQTGATVSTAPSVLVTDANNNPVSGESVTFAVASGGGSVVPTIAITTGADGIAEVTSWTMDSTSGSNTLTATSGSLTGSPLTFTATGYSTPQAPVITSLTAGYQQITVAFTAPSDNGGIPITNYEYKLNNSDTWVLFSPASTTSPFTITGLSNDATYSIQLRAVNNVIYGLASEAMSATPQNITVTITELERYSFPDSELGEPTKTILNAVTFPGVNGDFEGSGDFEGPDLNASFGLGDHIVMRFVPPAGSFFAVKKHPDAPNQIFGLDGIWQSADDKTNNFSTAELKFKDLTGTEPTIDFGNTTLSDNGQSLVAQFLLNVTADFTFTALEISFPVIHNVARTNTAYGSVTSRNAPSFGVRATGPENLKDMVLFSIVGAPIQLVFTSSTDDLASGTTRQLTVEVRDLEGDLVVNDNGRSITFSKTNGDGTVRDLGSAITTSGIATLTVTGESSGEITIGAIASDLDSASTAFAIIAGAASSLAFVAQPSNAVIGASIGSIAVEILDANGNRATDNSSSVALSIANNAGSATLSGTVIVNAVSGLATFNGLSINKVGAGYALSAAWSGPTAGTSSAFNVTVKPLTIADPTLTRIKIYDGNTTAAITAGDLPGVLLGDDVTITTEANYDNSGVDTDKTITVVYTLAGADAAKYTAPANFVVNDGVITTKALTVTADADQSKVFGATDLTLTYLLSAEVPVTGALARADGENVGAYALTIGTLSAGDNYTIDFKGGDFEITAVDFVSSGFSIDTIADQTQTGSVITPSVVVSDGTVTLTLDTDYTVAYTNNTDVGTVRVTVTGRGNYSGTLEEEFLIVAAPADPEAVPISVNGGPGLLALIALLWWLSMRHLSFSATRANSHRRLR